MAKIITYDDRIKKISKSSNIHSLVKNLDIINTYRVKKGYYNKNFVHYTSAENLVKMISGKKIRLTRIGNSNDSNEKKLCIKDDLFSMSFSRNPSETVLGYALYGGNGTPIRISFKYEKLRNYIKYLKKDRMNKTVEFCDVLYYQYYGKNVKTNNSDYFLGVRPGESLDNNIISQIFSSIKGFEYRPKLMKKARELSGKIKLSIWIDEQESRLLIQSNEKNEGNKSPEYIYIDLTDDLLSSMEIRFAPWLDRNTINKAKCDIKSEIKKNYPTISAPQMKDSSFYGTVQQYVVTRKP